jgi:hypothetical protein
MWSGQPLPVINKYTNDIIPRPMTPTFTDIPEDVLRDVFFPYFTIKDKRSLSLINKNFYKIIQDGIKKKFKGQKKVSISFYDIEKYLLKSSFKLKDFISAIRNERVNASVIMIIKTLTELKKLIHYQKKESLDDNFFSASLNFGKYWMGEHEVTYLSNVIQTHTFVQTVDLSFNRISMKADTVESFAKAIKENTSVKTLYLLSNEINAKGAEFLAEAIEKNNSLHLLDLGDNAIGTKGALCLAHAIKKNNSLQKIYLNGNKIGDEGALALVKSITESEKPSIDILDLTFNHLSSYTKKEIKKLFPWVKV